MTVNAELARRLDVAAAESAGLRARTVRDNPQYQFISQNAQGATRKYGVKSVSLLAIKI